LPCCDCGLLAGFVGQARVRGSEVVNCLECGQAALIVEYAGVEVDFCPACGGCWLDEGELSLATGGAVGESAGLALTVSGRKGKRRCPRCARRMKVGAAAGSKVDVDVCPTGHGVWLDAGELAALIRERSAGGGAAALARHCAEVFGKRVGGES